MESAREKGDDEIRRRVDEALAGTSVTVVFIGEKTAGLDYVDYAIERSIKRQNGILGLFVHEIEDEHGKTSAKGQVPYAEGSADEIESHGYATHDWDPGQFADWVEEAATEWKLFARPQPLNRPEA